MTKMCAIVCRTLCYVCTQALKRVRLIRESKNDASVCFTRYIFSYVDSILFVKCQAEAVLKLFSIGNYISDLRLHSLVAHYSQYKYLDQGESEEDDFQQGEDGCTDDEAHGTTDRS